MKRKKHRTFIPILNHLEDRTLLSFSASWIGQVPTDFTGSGQGVGYNGIQDIEIQLNNIPGIPAQNDKNLSAEPLYQIDGYVEIQANGSTSNLLNWETTPNNSNQAYSFAEFVGTSIQQNSDLVSGDLYFSPNGTIAAESSFLISYYYQDGTFISSYTVTSSAQVSNSGTNAFMPSESVNSIPFGTATITPQNPLGSTYPGYESVQLSGTIPTFSSAVLSDEAGDVWYDQTPPYNLNSNVPSNLVYNASTNVFAFPS